MSLRHLPYPANHRLKISAYLKLAAGKQYLPKGQQITVSRSTGHQTSQTRTLRHKGIYISLNPGYTSYILCMKKLTCTLGTFNTHRQHQIYLKSLFNLQTDTL